MTLLRQCVPAVFFLVEIYLFCPQACRRRLFFLNKNVFFVLRLAAGFFFVKNCIFFVLRLATGAFLVEN